MQNSARGQQRPSPNVSQRGGMISRPGLNITRQDPSMNQTAAVAAALTSKGAISITVQDRDPKPPPLQMRPGQQHLPPGARPVQQSLPPGARPPMPNQQRNIMRQPHPGAGMRPGGPTGYGNVDPYYMAAYGKQPPQGYPPQNYSYNQMSSGAPRPPQQAQPQMSPGSSWHTPQGLTMAPMASQPMMVDNSFKITIPSRSGGRSDSPDIVTLDKDGAPIFSTPQVTLPASTASYGPTPFSSMSGLTSVNSSVPKVSLVFYIQFLRSVALLFFKGHINNSFGHDTPNAINASIDFWQYFWRQGAK